MKFNERLKVYQKNDIGDKVNEHYINANLISPIRSVLEESTPKLSRKEFHIASPKLLSYETYIEYQETEFRILDCREHNRYNLYFLEENLNYLND